MDQDGIKRAISSAVAYLTEHPDEAVYTDSVATARLEQGLRCRVEGPSGEVVFTDMPASVGGEGSAPSAGWLFRAALAGCVATLVAMEAARDDVRLDGLEVAVESGSDDRGILGIDESIPAGPLSIRLTVRVVSSLVPAERLERLARIAVARCPVSEAAGRAVPVALEVRTN
jgi:uncharacterized OsmC-like protein